MKTSEQTDKVWSAIVKARKSLKGPKKDSTNPHFKSKYADLAECIDAADAAGGPCGLVTLQEVTSDSAGVCVSTLIVHESGQWVQFDPLFIPANKQDAQGFGSAASYARRYAIKGVWNMADEDDDGNAAVASTKRQEPLTVAPETKQAMPPRGFYRVTAYSQKGEWHEATVIDADRMPLKVSTKRQQLGALLLKFAQDPEPVWLDLTMKKGSATEAYLNDIKSQAVYLALQQIRPEPSVDAMEASPF